MRTLFAALLLAASSHAAPATDVLLPPDATAVFGLRASSLIKLIASQGATQMAQFQTGMLLASLPVNGFDPFHDIDEVVLATSGKGKNPPFLAVITGRFDAAKLAHGKGSSYHNALFIDNKDPRQTTAFLGDNTILAGDRAMVRAAIDRSSSAIGAGPLAARIESMRSRYDLWAFADHLDAAAIPPGAADTLRSLDRFSVGMAFNSDFALDAEIHLASAQDAAKLSGMLGLLEKQALSQMPDSSTTKFNLSAKDNTVKLSIAVPEADFRKALQQAAAGAKSAAASRPVAFSTAPAPKPREQQTTTDTQGNTVTLSLPYRPR